MHQHNSKHLWWMLALCIGAPLLLVLASRAGNWSSGSSWLLFAVLALCIGSHVFMMSGKRDDTHGH